MTCAAAELAVEAAEPEELRGNAEAILVQKGQQRGCCRAKVALDPVVDHLLCEFPGLFELQPIIHIPEKLG
jgi:hypothetical protein